jgi:protocatechuate 3,4-dioxygenase alpha subunit
VTLTRTPSQTVGPFYSIGLCRTPANALVESGVELRGTLYDGEGAPIADGMVELWDAAGGHWGRCGTDEHGGYTFVVPREAARLEAFVFARGLLRHQWTRIYLPGGEDRILAELPAGARSTLLAVDEGGAFRFDVHMQGDRATVFFVH